MFVVFVFWRGKKGGTTLRVTIATVKVVVEGSRRDFPYGPRPVTLITPRDQNRDGDCMTRSDPSNVMERLKK